MTSTTRNTVIVNGETSVVTVSVPGPQGPAGEAGAQGPQGEGSATVAIGTVTTGNAGSSATVTNSGTTTAAVLDFTIPKGDTGATGSTGSQGPAGNDGSDGAAATIAVGSTTTGDAGTNASVTNSGTSSAATFNFTIPKGDTGATGAAGSDGSDGAAATIAVGTVTTGAAGSSATVTNVGSSSAATFNFSIPKGDTGAQGPAGQDGQDGADGAISDGDKGDIVVSNSGATFTIDNDVVTAAKLADTSVTAGSYTNTNITVDAQGRITAAASGSAGGVTSVTGSAPISSSGGATPAISISAATTSAAGSMSSADKTKLDGIESNATADQTASEIRTLVEAATDSNVFTDADHTKLDGIEASATADQTASEIKTLLQSDKLTVDEIADDAITDAKLANSINTAIAANTAKVTNATHTGDVTGATALTIADDAVTYAKIQNVSATDRILGRDSAGAGVIEEITPANLRTMINVENGATADQTKSDIDALGIAASTATTLANARTIAGASFDGSANIDISYTDLTNKLSVGDGGLTQNNFTDALKTKLDGANDASNLDTGTISASLVPTLNQNTTGSAATLTTSRAIAGVQFDGSADISLNNNAITNGAGYITATDSSITSKLPLAGGTISGDLTVSGNLAVNGTTTTIDTTTLTVEDKNIEIGKVSTPTDTTADGGGLTLKGATDKTFQWADATDSWTSSENINLASGKVIKAAGTQILSATNYTGTAAIATNITVSDESSDTSCNVLFTTDATGNLAPKSGTNLTFNSSTGVLTATGFSGALTGNATGLSGTPAITVGVVTAASLDISGDADIDGTLEADAITVNGTALATSATTDTTNADNISSGTLAAARVATLNQNTTGTSGGLTGTPSITVNQVTAASLDISGDVDVDGTLEADAITVDGTALAASATTDTTNASNISSGTLAAARVATLNQDTTGSAATLTTARNIAGVAFDGSADISLNNNAITNGAGYIDGSALNAANLSSGTIPDARFPATLPAVSGANLTNLPSTGGTVGPGNEKLFVEAENQMDASFSTTANFNYVAASPMIIASGATLTVTANSTMTFV